MEKNDYLTYSDDAKINVGLLLAGCVERILFVEDKDSDWFYETLLKNLFNDNPMVDQIKIIPMNCKNNVYLAYNENGAKKDSTFYSYLVDGDFDLLINDSYCINDDCFIYLKRYDMESYLFDSCIMNESLAYYVAEREYQRLRFFNFDSWFKNIVDELYPLFITFAFIQKNKISEKNVELSIFKFKKDHCDELDSEKISSYISSIKAKYKGYNEIYDEIERNIVKYYGGDKLSIIDGKYILHGLVWYIETTIKTQKLKRTKMNVNYDHLRIAFLKRKNFSELNFLKNKLQVSLNL